MPLKPVFNGPNIMPRSRLLLVEYIHILPPHPNKNARSWQTPSLIDRICHLAGVWSILYCQLLAFAISLVQSTKTLTGISLVAVDI